MKELSHDNKYLKFKSVRIENGKQKRVVVDICGNIINDNPTEEELKDIKQYVRFRIRDINKWSDANRREYLLEFIKQFYIKEGRVPETKDFSRNPKYPSYYTYIKVFGSWNNAIREAELQPQWGGNKIYTDEELLKFLIQFYEENGSVSTEPDFRKNPKYPNFLTYINRFGSWQKVLKIVGLDVDSMVRKDIVETSDQKARLGEMLVLYYLKDILKQPTDLSGENKLSPCDGTYSEVNYDVKTASFDGSRWTFYINNVNIDEIEWFYMLAFNENFTKLMYAWGIPALDFMRDIDKGFIQIGLNDVYNNNLENLKEYEITDKIKYVFEKWRSNLRKWTKEEILADARSKLKAYIDSKKSDENYDKKNTTNIINVEI